MDKCMDIFFPIQLFADIVTYQWMGILKKSYLGDAVNFFIYDTIKIFLLLIGINYVMAIIRYYLPVEKIRDFLTKRKWYGLDYLLASLFGVITPFCSCSSIPLFVGFLSAGVPLGVTLAFLITSPLSSVASIVIFMSIFGLKITLLYVLAGIVIGMIGGFLLGKMSLESSIDTSIQIIVAKRVVTQITMRKHDSFISLTRIFWNEGFALTRKILPYVILGVGIGALIHGYIPMGFFEKYLKVDSWWSVPLATILAVPLYSNDVGVIPVLQALIAKGVPFGTALSFMIATVGLSLPEALILKKAMQPKLLIAFYLTVIFGIIAMGYIFNGLI